MTNLDSILKNWDYFANKGPSSQGYGFSSGHVWMWGSWGRQESDMTEQLNWTELNQVGHNFPSKE